MLVRKKAYRAADIAKAWSPFYILTAAITIWSLPAFKALFQEGGLLYQSTLLFKMPFLHQQIMKNAADCAICHAVRCSL